jgi:hypothetical protein
MHLLPMPVPSCCTHHAGFGSIDSVAISVTALLVAVLQTHDIWAQTTQWTDNSCCAWHLVASPALLLLPASGRYISTPRLGEQFPPRAAA